MSSIRRLDEVSIFGEKLTFLIPHEWVEVDDGDEGIVRYQLPKADSGWFRASLITTNGLADPVERLSSLFDGRGPVTVNVETGNFISRTDKDVIQDGEPLHIYYWFVAGVVPPDIIREAVFSYTVLADRAQDPETGSDVRILGELLAKARFS